MIEEVLAVAAASVAAGCAVDVTTRGRERPGSLPAAAALVLSGAGSAALAICLGSGWPSAAYAVFHLAVLVLTVPMLAVAVGYRLVGTAAGRTLFVMLVVLAAAAAVAVTGHGFASAPDASNEIVVGELVAPPPFDTFDLTATAIIGALGAGVLVWLVGIGRNRKAAPRLIAAGALLLIASALIAGAYRWSTAGSVTTTIPLSLALTAAAVLTWTGVRLGPPARTADRPLPTVTLAGPSIENPERAHVEVMIGSLERAGYRVICPARDIEDWGNVGYTPEEATRRTCRAIDQSGAVVVDLHHGYGVVSAGYAHARGVPIIMATPEGSRIPRPLRGVATTEVYYRSADDVVRRLAEILPPGLPSSSPDRIPEPA